MQFFQLATYFLGLAITVNAVTSQGTDVTAENTGLKARDASSVLRRRQERSGLNIIPCGFFKCAKTAKCVTDPPANGAPAFKHCVGP
ncbi:hypothetical protein PspLS_11975 [Pyricularia sp. CBS 133598]|nr:hypothetical protein PspLS_11975 [Pyricularia sp. CBS 133598]